MRNRDNPLIPAVKSGDIQALVTIMAAESAPTKLEINEAFFLACESNQLELVKHLLCYGVDVNAFNQQGQSLLMLAVISQDVGMVAWLLENGADANAVDCDGDTPLMHAAKGANHEILALLLYKNANVAMRNRFDWSALSFAVFSEKADNVKTLLHHHRGSRVTVDDIQISRSTCSNKTVAQIFQAYFKMHKQLKETALRFDLDEVNRLISLGVNVNLPVKEGYQYSLDFYDFVYSVDISEYPVLLMEEIYRRPEYGEVIVRALIEAGGEVNVNHKYSPKAFPLDIATMYSSKALVEFMRGHGAKFYDESNALLNVYRNNNGLEVAEKVKYLLNVGMSLPVDWDEQLAEEYYKVKPFTRILVDFINEKIDAAFSSEFNADALQGLVAKVNERTSRLSNQKSARALVRGKIEECVQTFAASLEGCDDPVRMANEEKRIKALAELEILKKKPGAKKEKTATLKLLDAIRHVEMLNVVAQATPESKALFETLRAWVHEKPFTDKIEKVIVNQLLNPLNEKDQGDLHRFLAAILNEDERKALKKMVYDVIEKWSKKYKLEEEQAASALTINKIKTSYDNKIPCALFELLRTSDSGRTNVNTGTWKDFVNVMEHGNYLKKQPEKLFGLFGGRKAPVKPSENEGMFSMKLLGSNE